MHRTFRRLPRAGSAAMAILLLLLSGCDLWHRANPDERREANFVAAYNYNLQGAYDDAVAAYNRALEANPNNAAAHWDLGFLYQDKFHDYVLSIYHFRRCQQIKKRRHDKDADDPTIENAVRQGQIQLAIQFASALGQQQTQTQLDDLRRRNAELEATIKELKLRLAASQPTDLNGATPPDLSPGPITAGTSGQPVSPKPSSVSSTGSAVKPVGPTPAQRDPAVRTPATPHGETPTAKSRIHTVRAGETLATIARHYGVTVPQLQSANRNLDPRRLRPGQSVVIPEHR